MKRLKFYFQDLKDTLRYGKKHFLVILFGSMSAVFLSLILLAVLFQNISGLKYMEIYRCMYRIRFESLDDRIERWDILKGWDQVLFNEELPLITETPHWVCSVITGWDDNIYITSNMSWYPVFSEAECAQFPGAHRPVVSLLEGRWFQEEELISGARVMVLSQEWIQKYAPEKRVGDTLEIIGNQYEIIGICEPADPIVRDDNMENYIPFRTACNDSREDASFYLYSASGVTFQTALTREQRDYLTEITAILTYEPVTSQADAIGGTAVAQAIQIIVIVGVLLAVCAANIYLLFRHLILRDQYRYMVYKVCGAGEGQLRGAMSFTTVAIALLAGFVGVLLYWVVQPRLLSLEAFEYALPMGTELLALVVYVLVIWGAVYPTIQKVSQSQPMDRALWR